MPNEKIRCSPENAAKFAEWIDKRGGVAVWRSVNLSNPGASWSTPALSPQGEPNVKPTWQAGDKPERVVTSIDDVEVETGREVKRVKIALHRSGFGVVLTDHASRKVRAACEAAGSDSWYVFDYDQAVIMIPDKVVSLREFLAQKV